MIELTIPGEVIAKGRPKFTSIGGYARAYTPIYMRSLWKIC